MREKIRLGQIVAAPIGKNTERALVVRLFDHAPLHETKEIESILTPAILPEWQIEFAKRLAHDTFCPVGRFFPLFLPLKVFEEHGLPPNKKIIRLKKGDFSGEKLGKKMTEAVKYLQKYGDTEEKKWKKECSLSSATFHRLLNTKNIQMESLPISNQPFSKATTQSTSVFFSKQEKERVREIIQSGEHLLFGSDTAEKRATVFAAFLEILKTGKSVLLLTPTMASLHALTKEAENIFGNSLALFHSLLTPRQKERLFWRVKTGNAKIIIGTRAALFLPFSHLGLIALEDEHEGIWKSLQSPRLHAREGARTLSHFFECPLILTSATPSMESFFRGKKKEIRIHILPTQKQSANIKIIDMKTERQEKNTGILSRALFSEIKSVLKMEKQVLLFLNRRGFFPVTICEDCGDILRCQLCAIPLVSHLVKRQHFFLCHHCGTARKMAGRCGGCGGERLRMAGSGTQQTERILTSLFPETTLLRVDRDSQNSTSDIASQKIQCARGEAKIIIGTTVSMQQLSFQNIGLIGVLDADIGRHVPDFRAEERVFQTLIKIQNMAHSGQIFLQTQNPDAPIFSFLHPDRVIDFLEKEEKNRAQFFLPPFCRVAKLIFLGRNKTRVFAAAREVERVLKSVIAEKFSTEKTKILLSPALIPKQGNRYVVHILLFATSPEKILHASPISGFRVDMDAIDTVG